MRSSNFRNSACVVDNRSIAHVSVMGEKIYSGQFMISKYDEESDSEDIKVFNKTKGYDFESSLFKKNFTFSNGTQEMLEIDGSLQKMFQFLSLAMSGKITNPKWNSFKGIKFQIKDKIRLNNIIWREYHMQFVKKLKPVVVQFASPLTETPQILGTVVLEGKYWKRKNNIIVHQYKKWREFSKHKFLISPDNPNAAGVFNSINFQRNGHYKFKSTSPPPKLNDIFMDLDDLDLPYCDMSEDELTSEIMQPQLTNLQPRMDSSIDFLNDFLCSPQKSFKKQKMFSSETCLNSFESSQKQNSHCKQFDSNRPNYFQSPSTSLSEMIPITLFNASHAIFPEPSLIQYSQRSFQADGKPGLNNGGLCKTPNLLSILLQPIPTSVLCQISENKPISCETGSSSQNNSLITTAPNYAGSQTRSQTAISPVNPVSSNLQQINNTNLGHIYQNQSLGYQPSGQQPSTSSTKYKKAKSPSLFKQSMMMRHSLSANNVVQQYLDELNSILTTSKDHNKISKAALLHKASEHIKRLRNEKYRIQAEIVSLQNEIDALQNRFSVFCSQLPATGVCLNLNRSSEGRKWFDEYVLKVSASNWKFYIFCMMFESLFTTYDNSVSTLSMEALAHNVASWLEKECSLTKLRMIVINGMRTLSRKTSIVHNPKKIVDEVKVLASNSYSQKNLSHVSKWTTSNSNKQTNSMDPDPILFKQEKYSNPDANWPQMFVNHNRPSNTPDNTEI